MPESAFTTPLRLIWSMVRQRLPELHPEPSMLRLTTGLTNGSRRPARLTCFGLDFVSAGFFWFSTAISCFGCAFLCPAEFLAFSATGLLTRLLTACLAAVCWFADGV